MPDVTNLKTAGFALGAALLAASAACAPAQMPQMQAPPSQLQPTQAQPAQTMSAESNRGAARYVLRDNLTPCRLEAADARYESIHGDKLVADVDALVGISRRYRDAGNQYWGRISGTVSDTWTQDWIKARYAEIGLKTSVVDLPMPDSWFPDSWSGAATGAGKTVELSSVWPTMGSPATPAEGVTLPAVYVGLGSEAEFAGRDVRGKAVIVYSVPTPGILSNSAQDTGVFARAGRHGAGALLIVMAFPGNPKTQLYPVGLSVPTFTLGREDGDTIRQMIEATPEAPPQITLKLAAKTISGLKSALVIGELPGAPGSQEDIVIMAHRDAYFDGSIDNASGVAVSLAVAEYFAKQPQASRPRRLVVVSTPGHHGSPPEPLGPAWLHENRGTFLKSTALLINAEHVGALRTDEFRQTTRRMNTYRPVRWFLNGSDPLADLMFGAFNSFCVPTWEDGDLSASGEMRIVQRDAPALYAMDSGPFTHTDMETADVALPTGMEAVARAYAKIIDGANRMTIPQLRAPEGSVSSPATH